MSSQWVCLQKLPRRTYTSMSEDSDACSLIIPRLWLHGRERSHPNLVHTATISIGSAPFRFVNIVKTTFRSLSVVAEVFSRGLGSSRSNRSVLGVIMLTIGVDICTSGSWLTALCCQKRVRVVPNPTTQTCTNPDQMLRFLTIRNWEISRFQISRKYIINVYDRC